MLDAKTFCTEARSSFEFHLTKLDSIKQLKLIFIEDEISHFFRAVVHHLNKSIEAMDFFLVVFQVCCNDWVNILLVKELRFVAVTSPEVFDSLGSSLLVVNEL